ncbi:MAG: Gfo/Idh/MocA family protein [Armatimonadota bacterium]
MASTMRLAVMGIAHSHIQSLIGYAKQIEDVELVAIADARREDGASELATRFEIPQVFSDYEQLLASARPDAVLCCAENSSHVAVVEACAGEGVPVMVEKPLAGTVAEAQRIAELAQAGGIRVMTNWPFLWSAAFHKLHDLVREGVLGTIFEFRLRAGHAGPTGGRLPADPRGAWWFERKHGGGALLDFCCYGACESLWLIGEPAQQVVSLADRLLYDFGDTEDNAVVLVRYPRAFAILEATWTQHGSPPPNGPIVWGSEATAYVSGQNQIALLRDGQEEQMEATELPVEPSGPAHFVACLREGREFHQVVGLAHNLQVMAILDAGLQAAREGRAVCL